MPIVEVNGKKFHMDGYVKNILDHAKKMVREDWDCVFVVDGLEGSGKSRFALQIGGYLAKPLEHEEQVQDYFTLNDVVYRAEDFLKVTKAQKKYRTVVFDEAFRGMSGKRSMTWLNFQINKLLNEVRQKNLFLIIVLPSFFELDRYPALHRSLGLFHVYPDPDGKRGFVRFYDRKRKRTLFLKGKQLYNFDKVKANFYSKFTNAMPLEEGPYNQKKHEALVKQTAIPSSKMLKKYKIRLKILIDHMRLNYKEFTQQTIADLMGINQSGVTRFLNGLDEDEDQEED